MSICASYQIQGDKSKSGSAEPARSVTLVPWISCFEKVLRKFSAARERESFVMFFRALQARHDGTPTPDAKVIDWPVMNHAVTAAVRHLINPALPYAEDELRAIERQFPGYWIYLAETGRVRQPPSASQVRRWQLGEISDEIGATQARKDEREKIPPRPLPLTGEQKGYCRRYVTYRALLNNLEELAEYKRVLESSTYQDEFNANQRAMKERGEKRFATMKKDAAEQRASLDRDLGAIQAKASWFRNGHCHETPTLLKKTAR